ncbi:MAG TPA: methyltransferase, partial [Candidatus Binataceae bacterium]|nr:methyltransferase [Candidatus Binataceae bacterium]
CLLRSSCTTIADEAGQFFDSVYGPLAALLHMVKTGDTAFDHVHGVDFYKYLAHNPALEACFYRIMTSSVAFRYATLSSIYDFSSANRVVDVGGGEGTLLLQILRENSRIKGVLFDVAGAIDRAQQTVEASGLSHRCKLITGDFFDSIPSGADVYILAQILNNWRDDRALRILVNCKEAMSGNARLLILEPVHIPGIPVPPSRALISLAVMAQRGGRTRTAAQLGDLLDGAGFRLEDIHQLPSSTTHAITASLC